MTTTKKLTKKEQRTIEIQEAREQLLPILEKGNFTVYTELKHVSQSGMSRRISCYVATAPGELVNIDWYIERMDLYNRDIKNGGLKVSGCGMDMGFAVVYNLSSSLFRNEDGSYSHDGAYKLKQRWI